MTRSKRSTRDWRALYVRSSSAPSLSGHQPTSRSMKVHWWAAMHSADVSRDRQHHSFRTVSSLAAYARTTLKTVDSPDARDSFTIVDAQSSPFSCQP